MSNTTVTITYSNGETREFVASDDLEQMINDGHMFSVTTMHSDISRDEEMLVSKMYCGNPVAAMGHMMMMRRNAETVIDEEGVSAVIETLTACIKFISDEITSHQSGMSPVEDVDIKLGPVTLVEEDTLKLQRAELLLQDMYMKCRDGQNINQHNPYSWAELNEDLMLRLKEFMPPVDEPVCKICKTILDDPSEPSSKNCGGDCLKCMAEAGDPDCISQMDSIKNAECEYFHVNKNLCLHDSNLDNSCIGHSSCDHYMVVPF